MPRELHAVIWTRVSGVPQKMGNLVLGMEQTSFTYTSAYLDSGLPGFCLLGDASIWGRETVYYPVSERIPVFPRLLSLIPGSNPRNLQRRHYLDLLREKLGHEPAPGMETEWQLLLLGGHGGIGHIDVFADDLVADRWYQAQQQPPRNASEAGSQVRQSRSQLWRMLKHNVLDENTEFDPRLIEQALGPTPSVGGMIPKLLVSVDIAEQAEDTTGPPVFYPPGTPGKQDVVLKIEPPEYRGLLDLEALCLGVHRQAGFCVPDWRRYDDDELHFLAVARFDRADHGPLPMESLFSVIATGNHRFRETGDLLLHELGGLIQRLDQVLSLQPDTAVQLYNRFLMALLTGNGDLHLDNLALLGGVEDCRLAPVYDPAPMRAWPRHDLVSAIPFDAADYPDHAAAFVALGKSFGLSRTQLRQSLAHCLDATEGYVEQLMQLERVPLKQRTQLAGIVGRERELLQGYSD